MRFKKIIKQSRLLLCLVFCTSLSIAVFGQSAQVDSLNRVRKMRNDSISAARTNEVNFIVNQIENVYPYGRRGLSEEEWNSRLQRLHQKVDSAKYHYEYLYALRYIGALISDSHFSFPDAAVYNRCQVFNKTDTLLPLWSRSWSDGRVFLRKDYTNTIPKNAQIISVNGHSAQQIALLNREIKPSEELATAVTISDGAEINPVYWCNLPNFLFMEGERTPYRVAYIAPNSNRIDTAILQGMARQDMRKAYKKSQERKTNAALF